jgi:hypothetical protein
MPVTTSHKTESSQNWPSLRVDEWTASRDTLHMWTQIVGKIRLAHAPMVNHWWQVTLHVSPRGLTTSAIPCDAGVFDVEFDFIEHRLHIRSSDGGLRRIALESKSVADFYAETMSALDELGIRCSPAREFRRVFWKRTNCHRVSRNCLQPRISCEHPE